jgi:hypothetical protein
MPYKNKEDRREQNIKYLNTENGFLISKWNDLKKRGKGKLQSLKNDITREEFFELWEEHKKKYGWNCYYTGKPFRIVRKLAVKGAKKKHSAPPDLLSIDRFDSDVGYTKNNIVFCRWDFNDRKSNIRVEDCKIIIEKYIERQKRPERKMYFSGGLVQ